MVFGDVAFFPVGTLLSNIGGGGSSAGDLEGKYTRGNLDLESSTIGDSSTDSTEGSVKGNSGTWRLHKG
jgi:hypothetical protein